MCCVQGGGVKGNPPPTKRQKYSIDSVFIHIIKPSARVIADPDGPSSICAGRLDATHELLVSSDRAAIQLDVSRREAGRRVRTQLPRVAQTCVVKRLAAEAYGA